MWGFSINGIYLADDFSVKTRSFGLQWRPHRLTMNCWQESFLMHIMSNNFVFFFLLKDDADLRMESCFFVSKVCTLYHLVRMASLF